MMNVTRTTLLCLALMWLAHCATAQSDAAPQGIAPHVPGLAAELPLAAERRAELDTALKTRDYRRAETILVDEINRQPQSRALLTFAARLFFLDGQYLNAAIAYKKAEAIKPLDAPSRFTLAMAYVKLNRREWARPELERLAAEEPQNPLYVYWQGRLDYDAQRYAEAVEKFKRVIALDARFMRAWDNLGLCYEWLGKSDEAVRSYREAIRLNREQRPGSPWPHLNYAVLLIQKNELGEAEAQLKEGLNCDAQFAPAYFQLGVIYDKQQKYRAAVAALERAAQCDMNYAEPHYLLSRLYRRLGENDKSKAALETYQRLKKLTRPEPPR